MTPHGLVKNLWVNVYVKQQQQQQKQQQQRHWNTSSQRHNAKLQQAVRPHGDHRKEMQTKVVCTSLPFIRSDQHHLARHSEKGKKTRQTKKKKKERSGKTTSRNGQAWRSPSPRGQLRTKNNAGNWLWIRLWCSDNQRSKGQVKMKERACIINIIISGNV